MEVVTLEKELNSLAYHGRGIVIGKSADGKKAVIAYFIMGRSENSRNRIFVEDGEGNNISHHAVAEQLLNLHLCGVLSELIVHKSGVFAKLQHISEKSRRTRVSLCRHRDKNIYSRSH